MSKQKRFRYCPTIIIAFLLSFSHVSCAQTNCPDIKDDKKRLACYDTVNGATKDDSGPSIDELFSKFKKLADYSSDDEITTYEFDNCKFYTYNTARLGYHSSYYLRSYYNDLSNVVLEKIATVRHGLQITYPRGKYGIDIYTVRNDHPNFREAIQSNSIQEAHKKIKNATNAALKKDTFLRFDKQIGNNSSSDIDRAIHGHSYRIYAKRSLIPLEIPSEYSIDKADIRTAFIELVGACVKQ